MKVFRLIHMMLLLLPFTVMAQNAGNSVVVDYNNPKKYIIGLKMNYACELLRLERYTVTQVAELCRFSDVYFFSRQFKEYVGMTPTRFVKQYRSK